MAIVFTPTVDSLDIRPTVVINTRSMYLEPRVKESGEVSLIDAIHASETALAAVEELENNVTANTAAVATLNNAVRVIPSHTATIATLGDRTDALEASNEVLTNQMQTTTNKANQALNTAQSMSDSISDVQAAVDQNAQAIQLLANSFVPATKPDVDAVCT